MSPDEISAFVSKLDSSSSLERESAWEEIRHLEEDVVPFLMEGYKRFGKYIGRLNCVYYATKFSRTSEDAFQLGLLAIDDKATLVRYRACGLLAYSLRKDAIPYLKKLLKHPDNESVRDAELAIKAIRKKNHHIYMSRSGSGLVHWVVNKGD